MLGVSVDTLRRWEAAGKIEVERTPGGHRRYDVDQLRGIARNRPPDPSKRLTIGYARVSSHDQKEASSVRWRCYPSSVRDKGGRTR